MRSRRVLVDSNVLVYAAVPESPYCLRARTTLLSLERSESAVYISRQIIREFLVAMSRMRDGQWQQDQLFNAARTLESHYIVAEEHPVVSEQLYLLLGQVPCGGKQIHDANIVATMLAYDIPQLVTYNLDDFRRYAGFVDISSDLAA